MLHDGETRRYQKIYDTLETLFVERWEPVAARSSDREKLREAAEFLKPFEGCFVNPVTTKLCTAGAPLISRHSALLAGQKMPTLVVTG